jgi:tetratricopeptide (TPR) repeat protein
MRLLVALLLVLGVTVSPAAADWTEIRTPHYVFLGDASRADMRRIAQRFEQFHAVMQRLLSHASLSFSAPTIVIVFRDQQSFAPYLPYYNGKPRQVAGFAATSRDLNYVVMHAGRGEAAFPVVFHELAHLITQNALQRSATWFSEGVAEYYSTFDLRGDNQVRLGQPIHRHVQLLREQFMPLRDLLEVDHSSASYNEQSRATLFYAESWALVHFLRSNEQTRDRFVEYQRLVERGVREEDAIVQGFGLDLGTLEKALRNYIGQLALSYELWTLPEAVRDAEMSTADVDEAAVLPHLASVLLRLDRLADAEDRASEALSAAPDAALAHAVMARIRLHQRRSAEARALLERDLAYSGFLDHYVTASSLARFVESVGSARTDTGRAAALLRERVTAATAARDDVPEAWHLAAYSHLISGNAEEAGAAIQRALALAPANDDYRFMLAEVQVRQRDYDRARSTLGRLMTNGRTPAIRADAQRLMRAIAGR